MSHRSVASVVLLVIATQFGCASPVVKTQEPEKRPLRKVLFVGNSFTYYNNSLHNHIRRLLRVAPAPEKAEYRLRITTISGARLAEHAQAIPAMVGSEKWDAVVLQGHSGMATSDESAAEFKSAARDFDAIIRKHGARTVLFMTWAYADKPRMIEGLRERYADVGQELGAQVVPVGLAFDRSRRARPDIVLHRSDKRHPTVAGTYLAACVFYESLFGKLPQEIDYRGGLRKETARALRDIARATCRDYHSAR